jgi:hypothetical protein
MKRPRHVSRRHLIGALERLLEPSRVLRANGQCLIKLTRWQYAQLKVLLERAKGTRV